MGIVLGVGFAALNTGNNLLYLVLALMLAFLVLSGLLSEASLRGLQVERRLPRELFAGLPARVVLRVHNAQPRVASLAISLEDRLDMDTGPEIAGRAFALRVPPGERTDRSYVFVPERRGPLRWTDLRISTRFPFGLFVKSAELACPATALVYPHVERIATSPPRTRCDSRPDELPTRTPSGDEITGLREYVPGDPPGRVQWRPSLRAQRWLVGERGGDGGGEIEVQLDLPAGAPRRIVEDRIARAASEAATHLEAGHRVGLLTPDGGFAPRAGTEQRTMLLSHLARLDPHGRGADTATPETSGAGADTGASETSGAGADTGAPEIPAAGADGP